jgi:hypothetical protein
MVHIQAAERLDDRMRLGRRMKQAELPLVRAGRAAECRPPAPRQLVLLERSQNLGRPLYDRGRQAGQARDVNTVAAVGSAGDNLVQEDDVVAIFPRGDMRVHD